MTGCGYSAFALNTLSTDLHTFHYLTPLHLPRQCLASGRCVNKTIITLKLRNSVATNCTVIPLLTFSIHYILY